MSTVVVREGIGKLTICRANTPAVNDKFRKQIAKAKMVAVVVGEMVGKETTNVGFANVIEYIESLNFS